MRHRLPFSAICTSSTVSAPRPPADDAPGGQAWITVHDAAGRAYQVPLRPDAAYLEQLERDAARRDASRPAEELIDELSAWTRSLHELQRGFAQRPR